MADSAKNKITIVVSDYDSKDLEGRKSIFDPESKATKFAVNIDPLIISNNLKEYLNHLRSIFSIIPNSIGQYDLQEITLTLEIGASGEVRLIAGIQSNIKGGINIKLVKKERI